MTLPRVRVTLLNLMLAMAVVAATLAVAQPGKAFWPTYVAVTWIGLPTTSGHGPAAHDALRRELTDPALVEEVLEDPSVAGPPRFVGVTNRRGKLLESLFVSMHPGAPDHANPGLEVIRIAAEARSAPEAVLLRDAFVRAYLARRGGLSVRAARPERIARPIFGRPWGLVATIAIGLLFVVAALLVPLQRGRGRAWRIAEAAAVVGLAVAGVVWWLLSHPELSWRMGGYRLL